MIVFVHLLVQRPQNMYEVLKINVNNIESITETTDGYAELSMISGKKYKTMDMYRDIISQLADTEGVSMEE